MVRKARRGGERLHYRALPALRHVALGVLAAAASAAASPAVECDSPAIRSRVTGLLQEIEKVVDPCGDSGEVGRILAAFRDCEPASYRICVDTRSPRNYVDPGARDERPQPTLLVWNPELRSALESSCDGDHSRPVLRDPTASLLHEIVHLVQDCNGLDPAAHEEEAVRIENVYRRARGLCQRTRYGTEPLPAGAFVACGTDSCGCPRQPPGLLTSPGRHRPGLAASDESAANAARAGNGVRASGDSPGNRP